MEPVQVAAALLSAVLHAGWNAAVKASPDPTAAMTAQMALSAVLVLPVLPWTGLPAAVAWPWIAASTTLNLVTITALLRAYTLSGFGLAYPVVRALSVLLVVPLAALLTGESLSPAGLGGVGMIAAALLLLALGNAGASAVPRAALGWIALAAVTTAAYVMCDAQGVRRGGSPLAYGCIVSITNAAAMLGAGVVRSGSAGAWRGVTRQAARAVPIAVASVVSYLLILWVWSGAPVAPAAALRDTSAIFAVVIAIVWLREPFTRLRLAAMLLAAAAVPLLRFA
ncbi:MAG: EamA family transporter [Alphaproteobacteria bacterium]|nr:EamA family transporter [Alphaproteobacteria bacterium]